MSKKRVLLLGASGFLGSCLTQLAPRDVELVLGYRRRSDKFGKFRNIALDLASAMTDLQSKMLKKINPHVVIHAARIEPFDQDSKRAKIITERLAKIVKALGSRFIYISSDAVFDGKKGNYSEKEKPHPVTNYGKAKLAAETAIRKYFKSNYVIVRPSYIYSDDPNKLDKRTALLVSELRAGKQIFLFSDMYRSPILITDLVRAIWKLATSDFSGIVHVAGKRQSVYAFSRAVLKNLDMSQHSVSPDSIKNSKGNFVADTSLNTRFARKLLDVTK